MAQQESKKYYSGLKCSYEHEDERIVQHRTKIFPKITGLTHQKIKIRCYLEFLPRYLEFQYYHHTLNTNPAGLRCSPPGSCSKAKNACWCNVHEKLVFNDSINKRFRLFSSEMGNNHYLLNIQLSRAQGTTNQVDISMEIVYRSSLINYDSRTTASSNLYDSTYKPSSSTSYGSSYQASYSTIKLSFEDQTENSQLETINLETKERTSTDAKFKTKCHLLPRQIFVETSDRKHQSRSNLRCQTREAGRTMRLITCPHKTICWCPLINQLRSRGQGKIRVPVYSRSTSTSPEISLYFVVVSAAVDAENHQELELDLSITNNPYPESKMHEISYTDF